MENRKECLHEWVWGYTSELVLYCKKCDKEVFDLYEKEDACVIWEKYLPK